MKKIYLKKFSISGFIIAIFFCSIFIAFYHESGIVNSSSSLNSNTTVIPESSNSTNEEWSTFHGNYNRTGLTETNPASGDGLLWQYAYKNPDTLSSPAISGGFVYGEDDLGNIYCINAYSGELSWSINQSQIIEPPSPSVANGRLYIGNGTDVDCLNATTGHFFWNYTTGSGIKSSPAILNGMVYVGSNDGYLYCLDANNGSYIWNCSTGAIGRSSPAVVNGLVYIGSNDGNLYCCDGNNGTLVWSYHTNSSINSSPVIDNGLVYIGSSDDYFYCLNANNGSLVWKFAMQNSVDVTPAIWNDMVYISAKNEPLFCLNASNGSVLWNSLYCGYFIYQSSPVIANNLLYDGDGSSFFFCINPFTGEILWKYSLEDINGVLSSPAICNGMIFVPGALHLYCLPMIFPPQSAPTLQLNSKAGQIILNWQPPDMNGGSITGYKIYRGTSSGSETYLLTFGNVQNFTDAEVKNGQTYYYKISAINNVGEGPQSSECSITTPSVPTAPLNLQSIIGYRNITLNWQSPLDNGGSTITGYKIYRGASSGYEAYLLTVGNVLTFTDAAVANGQTYYYKIGAINSVGESALSNEVIAGTSSIITPPLHVQGVAGYKNITLSWQSPSNDSGSNIIGYKIYRSTFSGYESFLTFVNDTLNFTDINVQNGFTYFYKVSAINSIGEGALSTECNVTIPGVPTAPSVSLNGADNNITLHWNPPSNGGSPIIGYKIYCGNSSGGESYFETINNVTSFNMIVNYNQSYYFKISAINKYGEGALSEEINIYVPRFPKNHSISGMNLGEIFSISLIGVIITVISSKKRLK